jgi:hypothetical protein
VLSLDMRVIDPAWIGMKLRKLLNYAEPLGHFMAFVPGEKRQQTWPSTVAYVARLIIHRYAMLGVLDRRRPAAAPDGRAGNPRPAPGHAPDGWQALPRVRQRHRDPQGRVRLLHQLWLRRAVRVGCACSHELKAVCGVT